MDDNSGLFEGSIISCVAITIIPLIRWLAKHGTVFKPDWKVRVYAAALIFACLLIPLGTQARTGIVCIAVLGIVLLRYTRHPMLYVAAVAAIGLVALPFLPSSFTQRAETIKNYQADESASTRLAVWAWTWEYVKEHPMGGGFDVYRQNRIRYEITNAGKPGEAPASDVKEIVDEGRAFHSAYFEMLGEQGWPGLIIWLFIHVSGLLRMEILLRRYRIRAPEDGHWIAGLATALQQANIIYLIGAAFIGVAFLPFAYMLIAMQIALDAYARRFEREKTPKPFFTAKAVPA
jgi:probable O-glycosylation ligase (exosortase A-associated)